MSRQTNGEVWRQMVDQYNASLPPGSRVLNPFVDASSPVVTPITNASNLALKINPDANPVEIPTHLIDYPGQLLFDMEAIGLIGFVREHRFHPSRQWRLDLAHPELLLGIECHGGVFANGRHNRGAGFTKDREKMNAAIKLGWIVLEFTSAQIKSGEALTTTREVHTNRIVDYARG